MVIKFQTTVNKKDKVIIEKHLEDNGFTDCIVNVSLQEIQIPDFYADEAPLIGSIVAEAGNYHLDAQFDDLILND